MREQTNTTLRTKTDMPALDHRAKRSRALSLGVLLLFLFCGLMTLLTGGRAAAVTNDAPSEYIAGSLEVTLFLPAQDYSKFSHSYPGAHAALTGRWSCSICHTRRDNSAEPKFPQHKDCISCHQTQFTTPNSPLCTICHTSEGLSQQNPPLKKFPSLRSFNT